MLTLTAAAVPISVLVMVNFVRDIPRELIGAMLVDGGTEWTVFRRLIVPLSKPVLATLAIYDGLNVWNNFILPLVLTQSNSVAVLPLGLTKLEGQYAINVPAGWRRPAVGPAPGGPVHRDAQAGHAQPGVRSHALRAVLRGYFPNEPGGGSPSAARVIRDAPVH